MNECIRKFSNHIRQITILLIPLFASIYSIQTSAAADWPMYYSDANHSALNPANGAKTENVLWRFEIGRIIDPPGDRGINHSFAISSPVISEKTVYVRSYDDYLYAIDINNSKLRWKFKISSISFGASPAVVDGTVYIGSSAGIPPESEPSGYIYALDSTTGKLKWKYQTGYYVDSSPAVANGIVYFGSDGIFALNTQSGKLKWKYDTKGTIQSPLSIYAGTLYYSDLCSGAQSNTFCIYALDAAEGKLKWTHEIETNYVSIAASNGVVLASIDGFIHALDGTKGNLKWDYQTNSSGGSLFVSQDIVYLKILNVSKTIPDYTRFEAKLKVDSNDAANILDGSAIDGAEPLEYDARAGLWMLPVTLTEDGATKLRKAVIDFGIHNASISHSMIVYLDGINIYEAPFSPSLAHSIETVPIRNLVISIENETTAEELRKVLDRKMPEIIGLNIHTGKLALIMDRNFLNEGQVAYVDGISYIYGDKFGYGGDLQASYTYLYALGDTPPTKPANPKYVTGFGIIASLAVLLTILKIIKTVRR